MNTGRMYCPVCGGWKCTTDGLFDPHTDHTSDDRGPCSGAGERGITYGESPTPVGAMLDAAESAWCPT